MQVQICLTDDEHIMF